MDKLTSLLQQNPLVLLIMFFIALVSGVMTIVLGADKFYYNYLSKSVTLPVWLLGIIGFIVCLIIIFRPSLEDRKREMQLVEGQSFGIQQVYLDGKRFLRCRFEGSELVFAGEADFALEHNSMINTRITFYKYANRTLNVLYALYKDPGSRPLVEGTIANIREGKMPLTPSKLSPAQK